MGGPLQGYASNRIGSVPKRQEKKARTFSAHIDVRRHGWMEVNMDSDTFRSALTATVLDPAFMAGFIEELEDNLILDRPPYMGELLRLPRAELVTGLGEVFSLEPGPDEDELDEVLRELCESGGYSRKDALAIIGEALTIWGADIDRQEAEEAAGLHKPWTAEQRGGVKASLQEGWRRVEAGEDHALVAADIDTRIGRILAA